MNILARLGFFTPKKIPASKLIPIALGYIGYIVLCNVSLNINSVGFYQVCNLDMRMECGHMHTWARRHASSHGLACSMMSAHGQ